MCFKKFPEVPENLISMANEEKLFNAGKENVPGVRCFIRCVLQNMYPSAFEATGNINVERLPMQPMHPTEKV